MFIKPWSLRPTVAVIAIATSVAPSASAVIIMGGDGRNEAAPTDTALKQQAWDQQGQFAGGFLGTAVSPEYFITSQHIGLSSTFKYTKIDGTSVDYPVALRSANPTDYYYVDDPASELRLVKIDTSAATGAMQHWASVYTDSSEVGKPLAVFGRGTPRGAAVLEQQSGDQHLRGWKWDARDGVLNSWGTNTVDAITTLPGGAAAAGPQLKYDFTLNNPVNPDSEAALSDGDSGGGLFIQSGGVWKLAGINFAVDGAWKLTSSPSETPFNAAIFDAGGLYAEQDGGSFALVPDDNTNQAASSYSTRISSSLDFIGGVIGAEYVPEPATLMPFLFIAESLLRVRRRGRRHIEPS